MLPALTRHVGRSRLEPNVKSRLFLPRVSTLLAVWLSLATPCPAQQPAPAADRLDAVRLVTAARRQIGVTVGYDPEYRSIAYPGGDVPLSTGVCTDVVTRALREQGFDLQKAVHEDMAAHFSGYPRQWGLRAPDANIDHRRVPNLMTFFKRRGWERPVTADAADYHAGDVVTWNLGSGITHVGIVSDGKTADGRPLVIHNIGQGTREENVLFAFKIIGHYRVAADH